MHCLWLTRQDPLPANSGELIYSSGLLRALAASGARLTLLCHAADNQSAETKPPPVDNVQVVTTGPPLPRRIRNLFSALPSDADRLRSPALRNALGEQLRENEFDALIVDQAALGWAIDDLLRLETKHRPVVVYISHNREADIRREIARYHRGNPLKSIALARDARKYARLEQRLCRAADLITAITPEDGAAYARDYPGKTIIDLLPGYDGPMPKVRAEPLDAQTPRRVLLVGSFLWIAKRMNLEALLEVADPVFEREGIELQLVGKAEEDYAASIDRRFTSVTFHPNVPSIAPYLQKARMGLIADTVGGGFKLKTLEYGFNFLPIASLQNALGGIELQPNHHAIVEQNVSDLVESIVRRIDDFEFLSASSQRTGELFADRFCWEDRGKALQQALLQCID